MEKAKAIARVSRMLAAIRTSSDPYLKPRKDWKPEADLRDKPLSQITPEESEANLRRLSSTYPVEPVRLSDEALGRSWIKDNGGDQ
jgi:hypothetical protein